MGCDNPKAILLIDVQQLGSRHERLEAPNSGRLQEWVEKLLPFTLRRVWDNPLGSSESCSQPGFNLPEVWAFPKILRVDFQTKATGCTDQRRDQDSFVNEIGDN